MIGIYDDDDDADADDVILTQDDNIKE